MKEEQKKKVHEKYQHALQKGERFWPDSIYKDLLVSFAIFILLILLATFIGVPGEPKADPNDTNYIPRPEWYFLFLFQMLKYFPGKLEWLGTAVIPIIAVLILALLPFIDRNPRRYYTNRIVALTTMGLVVTGIVALTVIAVATTPPQVEVRVAGSLSEQIVQGQDLYSVYCVECHGDEGTTTVITGVEGLEGKPILPIHSQDVMYTLNDASLAEIINYGRPDSGMTPFGRAYGGELSPGDIDALVAFMRYTWDDRAELPAEAALAGAIPALGPDEVPSYEIHIQLLVKRYCFSCHRPGKTNNNFLMTTLDEILTTGDHAPLVTPHDPESLLLQVIQGTPLLDPDSGDVLVHQMPPTQLLKQEYIDIFVRWVMSGMPETADQAQSLTPAASP